MTNNTYCTFTPVTRSWILLYLLFLSFDFPTHTKFLSRLNAIKKILEYNKSHVHHKKWPSKPGYAEGWKVDVPEHAWVTDTPRIQTTPGGQAERPWHTNNPWTGQGRPRWTNNPLEPSRQSRAPLCLHLWRYLLLRRQRDRRSTRTRRTTLHGK